MLRRKSLLTGLTMKIGSDNMARIIKVMDVAICGRKPLINFHVVCVCVLVETMIIMRKKLSRMEGCYANTKNAWRNRRSNW